MTCKINLQCYVKSYTNEKLTHKQNPRNVYQVSDAIF